MAKTLEGETKDATAADALVFEGVFKPPIVSLLGTKPIKVAGPGRLEVTDDGLRVEGFRRRWPPHVKIVVGLGIVLLVVLLVAVMPLIASANGGESDGGTAVWILALIGPLMLIFAPLVRGYADHAPDKARAHDISYDRVLNVRRGRRTLVIDVFKGRPKGSIHFEPAGEIRAVADAIGAKREN